MSTNIIARILIILILTSALCSCEINLESIKTKHGIEQNAKRAALYLVPVEPGMEVNEDKSYEGRRFIFVNKVEKTITSPEYLRKIIILDYNRDSVAIEDDFFKNPNENMEIIVTHKYYLGKTTIELQSNDGAMPVNVKQADSILRSWHIKQNPFSINK